MQVKMVLALSFIPLLHVIAAFEEISQNNAPELELIIHYREVNYI